MYKRGMLALGQRQVELIHNTLVADGGEQAQADIADTVFAVQHGRNGHVGIDAGEDALYDMSAKEAADIAQESMLKYQEANGARFGG